QQLPGWAVLGATSGLHVWLQPRDVVDTAALVAAAAVRGVAVEATTAWAAHPPVLAGLVVGYATLDVERAAEAVARLADAVRDVGSSV
nr:PLP-dependent aminotransferase family protein [Pseudonocardiales bacterium]